MNALSIVDYNATEFATLLEYYGVLYIVTSDAWVSRPNRY
jgi:hypothetical protein